MIKKINTLIITIVFFFICLSNICAYTKEDIINLASSINTCSSDTSSLVSGMKATYTRMLNERDVSLENLNKIYNNINEVKSILNSNNVCSKEQVSSLSSSTKDRLYKLYKDTNKLITSSPKYVNIEENTKTSDEEVKVIIDSSTNEVKVYEGGTLIDVVGSAPKLNYVGINRIIIYFLIVMVIILILMIILKIVKKKSVLITSIIYVTILIIPLTIVFKDKISTVLDTLEYMSVKVSDKEKTVAVKDNKIISYPSYDSKYATIYINNNSGDVYFGDSASVLSKGIGQSTKTTLPGEDGVTVLSGHNTGVFKELFNTNNHDKIKIETMYGKFIYEIIGNKVVDDTDISSIEEDYDLILYTCYPDSTLYGNKRLVLYLNMVESEWLEA